MHLLHRSSVFGGGNGNNKKKALRRVGSSPRVMSRSDSIKKRSGGGGSNKKSSGGGGVKQGSKRARLRAGLAAALQELNLAGRRKRGGGVSSVTTQPEVEADAEHAEEPAVSNSSSRGSVTVLPLLLLLLMLALACVVALGRAPAVWCCTCAAWWCRGSSTDVCRREGVRCSDEVRPQHAAARQRW